MNLTVDPTTFRFFYANAGYVAGRRALGAAELARAERAARDLGVTFRWENSDCAWDGDAPAPRELLDCIAYLDGRVVASLGCIGDPDRAYTRVVEAELALEALGEIERARQARVVRGIW